MSLTVVSGSRKFKIPVTPGTLLSQVRDQACGSEGGMNVNANDYGLSHQGKKVDLTVPFRFANLVNNAQLDLVKLKKAESCRVKVRIPNKPDFIGQFSSSATVQDVLDELKLKGQLTLNNVSALPNTELASLGGTGGILFVYKDTPAKAVETQHKAPTKQLENTKIAQPQSNSTEPRSATVSLPSSHPISTNEPPEMNPSQFMTYYQHIKQQAEPQMLSKSTKAKLNPKKPVEFTIIRIKFPDQNTLEGRFANGEVGSDVYKFVGMYLREPKPKFELVCMKPHFVLEEKAHLVDDCDFGSRALLLFRTNQQTKGSFLNDRALATARPATAPPEPQHKEPKPAPKPEPKKNEKLKSKLTPKWLKLHK